MEILFCFVSKKKDDWKRAAKKFANDQIRFPNIQFSQIKMIPWKNNTWHYSIEGKT